jgi:hypothetical protein
MIEKTAVPAKTHFVQRKPSPRTTCYSKRKGEMAELIFVVKAASMGFAVCKPYGDSEPYDLVVGECNRLFRIQVKSVFTTKRWGYSVAVARKRLRRHIRYTAQEIDFIAAYVVPHDAWYIVPVDEIVSHIHIRLYPEGTRKRDGGHFEKYREAWDLLRLGAATTLTHQPTSPR